MPIVAVAPVINDTDEILRTFTDSVGTSPVTYTYLVKQEKITVTNKGTSHLILTVGVMMYTIPPNRSQTVVTPFTEFIIYSTNGVQSFDAISDEVEYNTDSTQQEQEIFTKIKANANKIGILKKNHVNVLDYGAIGDGVFDNTTAFTNAIAYVEQQNKTDVLFGKRTVLYVSPGVYLIKSSQPITTSILNIEGQEKTQSRIHFTHANGGFLLQGSPSSTVIGGPELRKITIYGGGVCNNLITVGNCTEGNIIDSRLEFAANSLIKVLMAYGSWIKDSVLGSSPNVITVDAGANSGALAGTWIRDCNIWAITNAVINNAQATGVVRLGSNWIEQPNSIVNSSNSSDLYMIDNYILKTTGTQALFQYTADIGNSLFLSGNNITVNTATPMIQYTVARTSGQLEGRFSLKGNYVGGNPANFTKLVSIPAGSAGNKVWLYTEGNFWDYGLNWSNYTNAVTAGVSVGGIWHYLSGTPTFANGFNLSPLDTTQSNIGWDDSLKLPYHQTSGGGKLYLQHVSTVTTAGRPTSAPAGYSIWDANLKMPMFWDVGNSRWIDSTGARQTAFNNATITTSTTSVVVNHGMNITPTSVIATAQGNIGSIWATNITPAQFTLNCATAPASDTVVSWIARG